MIVQGETALHLAAYKRNNKAMKVLLEHGCNPIQKDNQVTLVLISNCCLISIHKFTCAFYQLVKKIIV